MKCDYIPQLFERNYGENIFISQQERLEKGRG